ncbi:MAG: sec-independent translocase [Actinomycetota bacterium]|nr:sec-independent translocase [Actinomycetota bacterium]
MFNSLGWPELAILVVIALFVFGPERLPGMAAEAGRMLRTLRGMANNARADLQSELGPELGNLDLASLNPKTFVRKHLFDDEDPLEGLLPGQEPAADPPVPVRPRHTLRPLAEGEPAPYDADAT